MYFLLISHILSAGIDKENLQNSTFQDDEVNALIETAHDIIDKIHHSLEKDPIPDYYAEKYLNFIIDKIEICDKFLFTPVITELIFKFLIHIERFVDHLRKNDIAYEEKDELIQSIFDSLNTYWKILENKCWDVLIN